jgi:hypothetical protein
MGRSLIRPTNANPSSLITLQNVGVRKAKPIAAADVHDRHSGPDRVEERFGR